jgi:hypothetical protein
LQFKQEVIVKRNYPRSFCQLEFTQALDFVDLSEVSLVSDNTDFGFFPSECLRVITFALLTDVLPSFNIFSDKNMI